MNGWTEDELAAAVEAYRQMESRLASGADIEKARVYRELAGRHGRTPKAWEYRMQNISHVLDLAGKEWLPGLRPAANVGAKVEAQLTRLLAIPSGIATSVSGSMKAEIERESKTAEASGEFSSANEADGRHRVLAAIMRRRGQPAFRKALLEAYGGRCAMTGCDVVDALEAAHIRPYSGQASNTTSNGLLLRADVHTLFDLYLVAVDPASLRIALAPALRESTFGDLAGKELAPTTAPGLSACRESLAWHQSQCTWA